MRRGTKHSEETRAIIRAKRALQGCSSETRERMSASKKGRKQTKEWIIKRIASRVSFYDSVGRKTQEHIRIRMSKDYRAWRKAVFERDNYVCQMCGSRGSCELNADHIKPFAWFPELRFAIDNGRTLCVPCHRKTPTYARNKKAKLPLLDQEDTNK